MVKNWMKDCSHLWTKKALLGRFTVQKSYEVELPAILQDHPKMLKKITVKKNWKKDVEISDCRTGVWTRTEAEIKQKGWEGTG